MRDNDNIGDFDYEKDFNEAFNNVTESEIIDNQPLSLDPVIERRSIFPMEDPVDSTQQNNIISNETVMQMITENNIEDFERLKAEQNFPMAVFRWSIGFNYLCIHLDNNYSCNQVSNFLHGYGGWCCCGIYDSEVW